MRDIGLMGESTFKLWCESVGLIANPSQIDKTGWDFNVEFPFIPDSNKELDHQEASIECKFQVKSTDNQTKKVQIKLSNLQRFVKTQLPAFFILIEFDNQNEAQKAYVFHVENTLISRVLKRLREVDVAGDSDKLNKKRMTIDYSKAVEMVPLNGDTLKTLIISSVGKNTDEYIKSKMKFLDTTGYENGHGRLTFSVPTGGLKQLINASLGTADEIEIKNVLAISTRFGIDSKKPIFKAKTMKTTFVSNTYKKGTVSFKVSKLGTSYRFPCKVYGSQFNHLIKKEEQIYRLKTEFFEVMFNLITKSTQFTFLLNEDAKIRILKLKKHILFLYFLSQATENILVEINLKKLPTLPGKLDSKSASLVSTETKNLIENTCYLSEFFNLSNPKVIFNELVNNHQYINQLYQLLHCDKSDFKITFTPNKHDFDTQKNIAGFSFSYANIGKYTVGLIIIFIGVAKNIDNDNFSLVPSKIIKDYKIITDTKLNKLTQEDLEGHIDLLTKKYIGKGMYIIHLGNFTPSS